MRSAVQIRPAAPKNHRFLLKTVVFLIFSFEIVWAKMWVSRVTHTVTHTAKRAERDKEDRTGNCGFLSGILRFWGYITWAMKLPMVCAASSCFCRVAWV